MSEETPTSISEAFSSSAAGSLKCFDEEEAEGHDSDDDYLSSESEGDDVPGEDLEAGAVAAAAVDEASEAPALVSPLRRMLRQRCST